MSEMNDQAVVQDFSSQSVLAEQRLLYRWVRMIWPFLEYFCTLKVP